MRVEIAADTFRSAQDLLHDGGRRGAEEFQRLKASLDETAAMAGDDSTSEEFARDYDAAAREAVEATATMVRAFGNLGDLVATTAANHRRANRRSILGGGTVVDSDDEVPAEGRVDVLPFTPPTSLGGDNSSIPEEFSWILDKVQGFVWPNADVEKLDQAAADWKAHAGNLRVLQSYCTAASATLEQQRSPEIPYAVDAVGDLHDSIGKLADEYDSIGQACSDYAGHVREQREAILDLIRDLLRDAVIIQGIGIVLGAFTAGTTAAGAAAINAAKIAAQAPRFLRIVTTLRTLAAGCAAALRFTRSALKPLRTVLDKLADARKVRSAAAASPRFRKPLTASAKSLQKKYKHADDFGVPGSFNPANAKKFEEALTRFLDDAGTITKPGKYHGDDVLLNFNPQTGLCVIQKLDGTFVSGWKLSPAQLMNVIRRGTLGGG